MCATVEHTAQTVTKWMANRRRMVDKLVKAAPKATIRATMHIAKGLGGRRWSQQMDDHECAENDKLTASFLRGIHERTVSPSEATALAHTMAREEADRFQKAALDTANANARQEITLRHVDHVNWSGSRVFVDPEVQLSAQELRDLTKAGAQHVDSRIRANVIIVKNPTNPGMRNQTAAILCGLTVSTRRAIKTKERGIAIAFTAATHARRLLWVSEAFRHEFPHMSKVVDEAVGRPSNKWKVVSSQADFVGAVARRTAGPRRNHRVYEAIALVTKEEKRTEVL